MKSKIVRAIFILIIVIILVAIILNLCPQLEAQLHKITGWN